MSRIRTIKPEFWASPDIVRLTLPARLLFIGLWTFADDGGVLPADLVRSKMEVFPGDSFTLDEIAEWVSELLRGGLLLPYSVDGRYYWQITGWHHQRIDRPTLRYPSCHESGNSTSPRRALDEPSRPSRVESSRVESKGVETSLSSSRVESSRVESKGRLDTNERRKLESVSREEVARITGVYRDKIMEDKRRTWKPTTPFRERVEKAATVVAAGLAPESWLAESVAVLLEAPRRNPTNYLGKVLATALPKWDAYQRAIELPGKE